MLASLITNNWTVTTMAINASPFSIHTCKDQGPEGLIFSRHREKIFLTLVYFDASKCVYMLGDTIYINIYISKESNCKIYPSKHRLMKTTCAPMYPCNNQFVIDTLVHMLVSIWRCCHCHLHW